MNATFVMNVSIWLHVLHALTLSVHNVLYSSLRDSSRIACPSIGKFALGVLFHFIALVALVTRGHVQPVVACTSRLLFNNVLRALGLCVIRVRGDIASHQ